MNVDIYCKHCFKVIEVICTNLLVYEHSIHDKEYENISCNKCFSNEHVVVRNAIFRGRSLLMRWKLMKEILGSSRLLE